MIDHVTIPVRDLDASRRFYQPVFDQLGAKVFLEQPGLVIFATDAGMVGLRQQDEVLPIHVAFRASDRATVDAFHRTAVAAGGADNGAPGLRSQLHPDYYAAFVHDPDGHNVEAVCHRPG
jgi:catechol 2,3-dioxygenase-like lactoylglutathione lyase family enzyme